MLLLIDRAGAEQFGYRTRDSGSGDLRRYYCASAPVRAIVVCRHGLELRQLVGQVVDVAIGNDRGWRDFVREGNAGQRHTKVTVYRRAKGEAARTLSQILAVAPRDGAG